MDDDIDQIVARLLALHPAFQQHALERFARVLADIEEAARGHEARTARDVGAVN